MSERRKSSDRLLLEDYGERYRARARAALGDRPETETLTERRRIPWRERWRWWRDYGMTDPAVIRAVESIDLNEATPREERMVTLRCGPDGTPTVWCDPEIADLVDALNPPQRPDDVVSQIRTVASCSGHGHRPGVITLADGRELFIARNCEEAREFERRWPVDINGATLDGSTYNTGGTSDAFTDGER